MMRQLEAVYASGVFRPVQRVDLAENAHVSLLIFAPDDVSTALESIQGAAGQDVAEFSGCIDHEDAQQMAAATDAAFE